MFKQEAKIVSAIRSLGKSRYPNLLINQSSKQTLTDDAAKSIAQAAGLHYVNFRDDVLPNQPEIKLGAYTRSEFQEWLNNSATAHSGIILVNADVLIATWEEPVRKAFFKEYLLNGVNYGPA